MNVMYGRKGGLYRWMKMPESEIFGIAPLSLRGGTTKQSRNLLGEEVASCLAMTG
jgi:hypothetical protein